MIPRCFRFAAPLASPCIVGLLVALSAAHVSAANRKFWRFEIASDFLSGESNGVSVGPAGQVRLAPRLRNIYEGEHPFVWVVAPDGAGGTLAGGGAPGKLLRLAGEDAEVLAEPGEAGIHAVVSGQDGSIFFGTSPEGAVHQILPGGERRVLHRTESRYIWALGIEPGGSLLVATGMPAALVRVRPSGEAQTVFQTREENITALLVGLDGTIFVGTEPSGIVFRIQREGGAMALFDSPQAEIRALAVNAAGEVFAAAVASTGEETAEAGPTPAGPSRNAPPAAGVSTTTSFRLAGGAAAAVSVSAARSGATGTNHVLYRIASNGAAQPIWQSSVDRPLALAMLRDERLLLGTGDRGRVYRITRAGEMTLLLRTDSEQVTAAFSEGGATLLGASNPGRVLALSQEPRTEGRYRSQALDAGGAASFGRISWDARIPSGAAVTIETRSGNSAEPDDTWSDWLPAESGASVPSPAARFLEWRAVLRSDGRTSPELVSVEIAYRPANLAPRVARITLHPPGTAFEQMIQPSAPRLMGMEHLAETTEAARRSAAGNTLAGGTGRQLYRHGIRTATFDAEDPNGDRLHYEVSYRKLGEVPWNPLRSGLRQKIVAWDTSTMPDGRYELRVEATDTPDQPPEEALSGSRVSRAFTVDNTPPVISDLTAAADGSVRFRATDSGSPILRAAIAVNGGSPRVVRPVDGISDSLAESYDFRLAEPPAPGAVIVVRVEDDAGNWAAHDTSVNP